MLNILLLILAFLSTYFIVGFVFVELFFPKISFKVKFVLYIVLSLILSTLFIYLAALAFELSRIVIFAVFIPFYIVSSFFIYKLRFNFIKYFRSNIAAILFIILVALVYFVALSPAVLGRNGDYFVMSGVNWQDTALHLSITQSLTQGNFPPIAPYFSGVPLSYYYFTDLHSAIVSILYGKFFPRIFVYDNALLAGVLALTIYTLALEIFKNKKLSLISSVIGTFYGSFIFYKFFLKIFMGSNIFEDIAGNTYSMEYNQIFGMANMADYLLQNRPMMIGLPTVVTIILLVYSAFRKEKITYIFLAGLLTAILIRIQFFCVLAAGVSLFIISTMWLKKKRYLFVFKSYLVFVIPIVIFYLAFGAKSVNGMPFFDLIKNTFRFGFWDSTKPVMWHIGFVLLNLGVPFIVTLISLFSQALQKNRIISFLALVFVSIPYIFSFTIAEADMLKFFYFGTMIFAVITPYFLHKVINNRWFFSFVISVTIFVTCTSSILTLGNSYLNKNFGYSKSSYLAGVWIRNNTPQKSVFVTMPTIHSAPTDLAGRLRVISYTNWPYTHGFNIGPDNVFVRSGDVENVYKTGDINTVKVKYNANYLYYGEEERDGFPDAWKLFDSSDGLKLIYDQDKTRVYKII